MKKIILIIAGYFILTFHFLQAESIRYGGESGWNNTLLLNLRQIEGWMGKSALTLAPPGRNPFSDENSDTGSIDMLLLSESGGLINPPSLYDIEGSYRISQNVPGRSNTSIRPGRGGLKLFPSPDAMWSPGRIWGDFTLEFRLKPSILREGEVFFSWEGRDKSGRTQSVTAQVKKRRLVWKFEHFFQKSFPRSLAFSLTSTPLVPEVWNHHRIRFKFDDSSPDNTGSSSGYLEYLIDGIPVDSMFTTHDGREGRNIFVPRIGELSNQPIHLAPDFNGYFDEFQLNSTTLTDHPSGSYINQNAAINGKGRTTPISAGYPTSSLTGITARFDTPGLSQIRFFAQAFDSESAAFAAGFPDPGNPDWVELKMKAESEDPMGFGNWYDGEPEAIIVGRYFVVGYVFQPDPARDSAPVLSVLDVIYAP